jgi:hypothetical protein
LYSITVRPNFITKEKDYHEKTLLVLLLTAVMMLTVSSGAFAYGGGFGGGQNGICLRDTLDAEEIAKFDTIIADFRTKMNDLRERMFTLRNDGDWEGLKALREERFKLMEEKREAMSQILPDELDERLQNCGRGMRNSGLFRGEGNFKQQ